VTGSPLDLNQGAIAPLSEEIVATDLKVEGEIPKELNGLLARNGPNPFEGHFSGEGMLSWWGGAAMLHGIALAGGEALWYRNHWVRTGHWDRHLEPSTPPDALRDHNTNVNVISHSGQILALGEGSIPFAISPELDTLGPETFRGGLPGGMTAHPKVDPKTGELIYFRADWQPPYLHYGVLDSQGGTRASQTVELPSPAMMHDFAITENFSILLDLGVGLDLSLMQKGFRIPIRWFDERTCRLGVLPRLGGDVRWFEISPCFIQHVGNAYETADGELRLEAIRYPEFLRFDSASGFAPNPLGQLWGFTIDLDAGTVREEQLDEHFIELPRFNELLAGSCSDILYSVEQPTDQEMRGIVKINTNRQTFERFQVAAPDQNSEPIFVPRSGSPSQESEDDGWLLVCVYKAATHTSQLVILDATNITDSPQATIHLPQHIPAGFHGAWIPDA